MCCRFGDNVLVYHRWDQVGPEDDASAACSLLIRSMRIINRGAGTGMWRVRSTAIRTLRCGVRELALFDTDASWAGSKWDAV